MRRDFHLSGLHTNYTPERKSKQCFRQVHDVVQKQKTFDSWARSTKRELWEERRDQAVKEAILPLNSNVRVASEKIRERGEAEGAEWNKPIPNTLTGEGSLTTPGKKGKRLVSPKQESSRTLSLAQRTKSIKLVCKLSDCLITMLYIGN